MPIIIPGGGGSPTRRRSMVRKRRARVPTADTKSFLFDGTSDYVSQGNTGIGYFGLNDVSMGPWTVSVWFKTSFSSSYQWLWSIYDAGYSDWARIFLGIGASGYSIIYQTNSTPFAWDGTMGVGGTGANPYIGQAAGGASNPLCDGNWHHVSVTCEGASSTGKLKLYVDGSLASTGTQATAVVDPDRIQRVSGYDYNDTLNFNGNVAQVTLIKSELSTTDITSLYNGGNGANPSPFSPYQWYRFGDDPSDTTTLVVDNGSSGVNLTGYGPPTIVTDAPP